MSEPRPVWGVVRHEHLSLLLPVPPGKGAVLVAGGRPDGSSIVVLTGRQRPGSLGRAGYDAQRWELRRTRLGALALVPSGEPGLARQLRTGGGRLRPRQVVSDLRDAAQRRALGRGAVTVAVPTALRRAGGAGAAPWLLGAAGLEARGPAALLVSTLPRRRAVFLVTDEARSVVSVVKVGSAADEGGRASREQQVLTRLVTRGVAGVPRPLGTGTGSGLTWSCESAVDGLPLEALLSRGDARDGRARLAAVAEWFTRLALATRGPRRGPEELALRGAHRAVQQLVPRSAGISGVLVHGDVGAGHNVLVGQHGPAVIDWETAEDGGLPLVDLLPLLLSGIAVMRGHRSPKDAARCGLAVCRGEHEDSPWLLSLVRDHLDRQGVPLALGGALVAVALACTASRRLQHDELLRGQGRTATPWTSAADLLAPAWLADPELGVDWVALQDLST